MVTLYKVDIYDIYIYIFYPQLVAKGIKNHMGVAELSPTHGKQEAGGSPSRLSKSSSPQVISMTSALKEVGAVGGAVFSFFQEAHGSPCLHFVLKVGL